MKSLVHSQYSHPQWKTVFKMWNRALYKVIITYEGILYVTTQTKLNIIKLS